jgi:hypothetical protein
MASNFDWDAFFSGRKTRKNPRRSLASATRTPSALSQRGTSPSTERNIFEAASTLRQVGVYPSGEPIRSISQATGQGPVPVYPLLESSPQPAATSTRHRGGQGGSLPRGVGYSRSYNASQGAAQPSKGMKDLIDPQLWRLADGGSFQAMTELQRRGPKHYRPARPNPDTWFVLGWKGKKSAEVFRVRKERVAGAVAAMHKVAESYPHFDAFTVHKDYAGPAIAAPYCAGSRTHYNPTLAQLVDGGRGLRGKDLSNMPQGLRKAVKKGILHHAAHEPLWPAPAMSKTRPGYGGFLKGKTGWPAWKETTGWNHAKTVIQFMIMGRGNPADYPSLIRKMAQLLPPNEPALVGIWSKYQRNFAKIQMRAEGRMPTLAQLKKAKRNPRRRQNPAGFVQGTQVIHHAEGRPLFRWAWWGDDGQHGGYAITESGAHEALVKDVSVSFGIPLKGLGVDVLGADENNILHLEVFDLKTEKTLAEARFVYFDGLKQSGLASMLSDPPLAYANPYARKNFFWGSKAKTPAAPAAPALSYEEAERRAQSLAEQVPRSENQYYLVKMPRPGRKPGVAWYFLNSLRGRAFEMASSHGTPRSYIERADPWRDVYNNFRAHRSPEKYSVVLLDTLENKIGGVYSYGRVEATVKAKKNPGKFAGFMGTTHFQQRVQQRSAGLSKRKERKLRNLYSVLRSGEANLSGRHGKYAIQFGGEPGRQGDYLVVEVVNGKAVAFVSLLVAQSVRMGDTGLLRYNQVIPKVLRNPYWVEIGEDGSPRGEQIWTGPGRSYWGDRQFETADDYAVGETIDMVEPFGVRSRYEVIEAASGRYAKQRGKVRRKYGTKKNPMVWKEDIYEGGKHVKTVWWKSIGEFWKHVAKFDKNPGNAQLKGNWRRTPHGYKSFWLDNEGRWDVVFSRAFRGA